jgi:hypothetical protein
VKKVYLYGPSRALTKQGHFTCTIKIQFKNAGLPKQLDLPYASRLCFFIKFIDAFNALKIAGIAIFLAFYYSSKTLV